ncbi:MAG: 50S ribosomal protein L34e [Candidatus Diapherotrites archaeon CG08_land_8_20_14_0_20_30_16]|nr:MAG: 50S ribosomal protein L34e [Candidatus Diapherotrites archaeon CG08_land_8_20_14_0_20_30_16]
MVAPGKRNLKKKFVRTVKSTKEYRFREKPKGAYCALCNKKLQGVPRGDLRKLSKTEKRPSVLFGGILCSDCRDSCFDDAIMLKTGLIKDSDVSFSKKHYVKEAVAKIQI